MGEQAAERSPLDAFRAALRRYGPLRLAAIAGPIDAASVRPTTASMVGAVAERLSNAREAARRIADLPHGPRLALGLMNLSETTTWPMEGLHLALGCLGVEPAGAVRELVEAGLVAVESAGPVDSDELDRRLDSGGPAGLIVHAHPSALAAARTVLPEADPPLPRAGAARQVREADGLEPILRVAVVWQRVAEAPLRRTQHGDFYKRDRERIEDDPAIAGPIADALEPVPDMPAFWLELARRVGLLEAEPGSDRLTAAAPEFWSDNAFHLPQMLASSWLGLWRWHEQGGMQHDGAETRLALPFARLAVLLWLATLAESEWLALDDLAEALRSRLPRWDRAAFQGDPELDPAHGRVRPASRGRSRGRATEADPAPAGLAVLEAMLLGAAYQFGLVRVGEEPVTGRRLVQLTPMGRYLLVLGPPPRPPEAYDHFLFVQPNFEVIAYRQGLSPPLIGRLSRFACWSQVGAAMTLRLTSASVYLGLEGGMTPEEMLEVLQRHSARPLPPGVAEALRTWAGRRDRVTYHAAATLLEFGSTVDLERALVFWTANGLPEPARVSERILLVEDERAVPFEHLRTTGARDYRQPPETCVEVESDGVTLSVDPARSDLLVDAELARLANPLPDAGPRRRFAIDAETLARAAASGLSGPLLGAWFERRTGTDVPPAVTLLVIAAGPSVPELRAERRLLVRTPTAELLDGLAQHPATRDLIEERLGPTAAVVREERLADFRQAAGRLGFPLEGPGRP